MKRQTKKAKPEIKAIETKYKGYRFRSRLEARWAVFFDAAGIEWKYEQEGFEAEDGTRYLPDFYLPRFDTYVEVKPNDDQRLDGDIAKCKKMIYWGGPIKEILILSDVPHGCEDGGMWHFPCLYYVGSWGGQIAEGWWFFSGNYDDYDGVIGHVSSADYGNSIHWRVDRRPLNENPCVLPASDVVLRSHRWGYPGQIKEVIVEEKEAQDLLKEHIDIQMHGNKRVFDAFEKARQARFEHGECG